MASNRLGDTPREYVLNAVHCPELRDFGIEDVGWNAVGPGYWVERQQPDFSHITFCHTGTGEVLTADGWQPFGPGLAALSPRGVPHGARIAGPSPHFGICWLIYDRRRLPDPLAGQGAIALVPAPVQQVLHAIQGLWQELNTLNEAEARYHWAALLHTMATRTCEGRAPSSRIQGLCQALESEPARKWTVGAMGTHVGLGEARLRRVFRQETGRSPAEYLRQVRLRRAIRLLQTSEAKLHDIAQQVGYETEFALSHALRREHGHSPSWFRR